MPVDPAIVEEYALLDHQVVAFKSKLKRHDELRKEILAGYESLDGAETAIAKGQTYDALISEADNKRPICSYNSSVRDSSPLLCCPRRSVKIPGMPASACFFQCAICTGRTPNLAASSLTGRTPRIASTTTFALNCELYCFRVIVLLLFRPDSAKS